MYHISILIQQLKIFHFAVINFFLLKIYKSKETKSWPVLQSGNLPFSHFLL